MIIILIIIITHQTDSIIIMGTNALPAPLHTAATEWENASRQKNSEVVRA